MSKFEFNLIFRYKWVIGLDFATSEEEVGKFWMNKQDKGKSSITQYLWSALSIYMYLCIFFYALADILSQGCALFASFRQLNLNDDEKCAVQEKTYDSLKNKS